jgi:hypothetical protein
MITKYNDFLNEGFYDWMNKKFSLSEKNWSVFLTLSPLLLWFYNYAMVPTDNSFNPIEHMVLICITGFLQLPMTYMAWKTFIKTIYNLGAQNLRLVNRKVRKAEELIEKYPELQPRLEGIKRSLRRALDGRDKVGLARAIGDMYNLSQDLKKRETLKDIYKKSDEEIDREKEIKKIDPLGEDNWDDEPIVTKRRSRLSDRGPS